MSIKNIRLFIQDMIDEYDSQVAKQHHLSYVMTSSREDYVAAGKLVPWQPPIESIENNVTVS